MADNRLLPLLRRLSKWGTMLALGGTVLGAPKVQAAEARPEPGQGQEPTKTTMDAEKHLNCPDFIPTTEDGQFDEQGAEMLAEKLAPYMRTLAEKGDSITPEEAYKAYQQSVGEDAVPFEDFSKVNSLLADQFSKLKSDVKKDRTMLLGMILCMTGLVLAGSKLAARPGWDSWEDILKDPAVQTLLGVVNGIPLASLAMSFMGPTPGDTINGIKAVYEEMYNAYVQSANLSGAEQFKDQLGAVELQGSFDNPQEMKAEQLAKQHKGVELKGPLDNPQGRESR